MDNKPWCVYRTSHPAGFFYVGKSSVERVANGYVGSGRRLNCAFLSSGFEKSTWNTRVLKTFATEAEAYLHEAELVPLLALTNPWCLNDTPGGKGSFRGSPYALILKKQRKAKKAKSMSIREAGGLA